jgi:antitoxin component YwqK of YwqJK toxin-antitoxin module
MLIFQFRTLALLITCLISFEMRAQPQALPQGTPGKDFNAIDAAGKRHGIWIRQYKNKPEILYYQGQYDHGKPTGKWNFYDQEGRLMSEVDHVADSTINDVKMFYADGSLMAEGRYVGRVVNDKWRRDKEGLWKMYFSNGKLSTEETYLGGQKNGMVNLYLETGVLVCVSQYKNGMLDGPFEQRNAAGKKILECTYVKGLKHGPSKTYFEDGKVQMKGVYFEGEFDKIWESFLPNGRQEMVVHYNKGQVVKQSFINKDVEEFYESGIPKKSCSYVNGKLEGPFREYYDIGTFEKIPSSTEDQKIGIMHKERLTGTVMKVEGDYLNNVYEGRIVFRKETGEIDHEEVWEGGKMISTTAKPKP